MWFLAVQNLTMHCRGATHWRDEWMGDYKRPHLALGGQAHSSSKADRYMSRTTLI